MGKIPFWLINKFLLHVLEFFYRIFMHVFHVGFEKASLTFNFDLTVIISFFNKLIECLSVDELLNEVDIMIIVDLAL